MKALLYILISGCLFYSCNSATKENSEKNQPNITESLDPTPNLEGAWELVGFYNYKDNVVIDSFSTSEGYRQVKMYTDSKVMWSKNVPSDTTEWFGYGTYDLDENTLTEVLDYGSEMMRKIIDEKKEFVYEINLTENTFSQIEIDEDGNRIYSENYKRIE